MTEATPAAFEASAPPQPGLPGFEHIGRYWDPTHGRYAAKLLPGDFYVTRSDEIIVTILGSCVAACMRDPQSGVGGMNHFLLPEDRGEGLASEATRYGTAAMEQLINALLSHGARKHTLETKVFGGGLMLDGMRDVGAQNITFVKEFMAREGLPILAEDLGGRMSRKVHFDPLAGRIRVRQITRHSNTTLVDRERDFARSLENKRVSGGVELF